MHVWSSPVFNIHTMPILLTICQVRYFAKSGFSSAQVIFFFKAPNTKGRGKIQHRSFLADVESRVICRVSPIEYAWKNKSQC